MNLIAELIRSTDGGFTLKSVDLTQPNGAVESRLALVTQRVQSALPGLVAQAPVAVSDGDSTAQIAAIEAVTRDAFELAVDELEGNRRAPFAGPSILVQAGPSEGSTWSDKLETWVKRVGVTLRLNYWRAEDEEQKSPTAARTYYLSVRPPSTDETVTCPLVVTTPGPGPFEGVHLTYSPTRTRLVLISPTRGFVGGVAPKQGRSLDGPVVGFDAPTLPGVPEVAFDVTFVGDPPYLRGATFLKEDGPALLPLGERPAPGQPIPRPPQVVRTKDRANLPSHAPTLEESMAHRAALVAAMGDTDEARAHRFFLALDRATHPGVKPSPADGDFAPLPLVDVLRLGGFLADRYEARARYAHTGAVLGKGELDGGNLLPLAEAAGELLLGLMQEHFGEDGTGPLSATADAFERFGVGELHLFESHGAPNGTHIFSFCELALYLVDQGAPGSPFSRLFPIFGRACELFAVTYHACGAPRTRCSYQIANNELGVRAPDPSFRSDLAALWAGGSARRRYDSLVHAALVNDFAGERDLPFWSRTMTLNDQGCGLNVLRSLQGATSSHRPIR